MFLCFHALFQFFSLVSHEIGVSYDASRSAPPRPQQQHFAPLSLTGFAHG